MWRVLFGLLALAILRAEDVDGLVARIKALASKETPSARADTLERLSRLLDGHGPGLARRDGLPASNIEVERLVEQVEHGGDDPATYFALAMVIREHELSAGLDNPSIRSRIALLDLDELLNPVLMRLDGARVRLADYRRKPVLLAFWATWCVPCRQELPLLSGYASQHAVQGLTVLGFALDAPDDDLRKVQQVARSLSFPVGLLANSSVPGYGRIWRIPVNFTIDRKGRLIDNGWNEKQPTWTAERLERIVTPLLNAPT